MNLYYSFYERQLLNNKYRYEGRIHGIKYCIDSIIKKTEIEINNILESCSIDFLLDNEKYIINI